MTTTIQKWGNSLGLRIEKELARKQGLTVGLQVKVTPSKHGVLVERVERPKKSLAELVRGITPHNTHNEEVWGTPRGNEVW